MGTNVLIFIGEIRLKKNLQGFFRILVGAFLFRIFSSVNFNLILI